MLTRRSTQSKIWYFPGFYLYTLCLSVYVLCIYVSVRIMSFDTRPCTVYMRVCTRIYQVVRIPDEWGVHIYMQNMQNIDSAQFCILILAIAYYFAYYSILLNPVAALEFRTPCRNFLGDLADRIKDSRLLGITAVTSSQLVYFSLELVMVTIFPCG